MKVPKGGWRLHIRAQVGLRPSSFPRACLIAAVGQSTGSTCGGPVAETDAAADPREEKRGTFYDR